MLNLYTVKSYVAKGLRFDCRS